jgi:NADH:ubiquinone oxidoreductase subunit K
MAIPVEFYFVLSALLFFIGFFGFVTRRDLLAMLISVELVLNSVDLQFAAVNRLLYPLGNEGMFMTLFSIGVSAAESAVAVAIIINVYRLFRYDTADTITNMKN